ncbi:hypothetical protein ANCCAN_22202 [Ancylostoma caninum]|uniref:DEP domain-containing protein n=1 Tax=Ancylostoma caninum TaxID=29170 RepID=A0A368FLX9_ANCCA|nr:hypothetical protein ANCCAN_22202 [Ancylostoma caninum]
MIRRGSRCCDEENLITSTSGTSACPPQKPPRGCPRKAPVRIEPLRNVGNDESRHHSTNSPAPSQCRFSTTEKYQNMKNYFRQRVELQRQSGVFSGSEAVSILDEYLQTNREQFSGHIVKRENAIKVLEVWLRENVISPVQSTCKDSLPVFQDSKKVMYSMNRDEDHKLYICASPMLANRDSGGRPSRSSSFKRFFSPGRLKCSEATTGGHKMLSRSPSSVSDCSGKSHRIVDLLPLHRNAESRPLADHIIPIRPLKKIRTGLEFDATERYIIAINSIRVN